MFEYFSAYCCAIFLFSVARGLANSTFARSKRARAFACVESTLCFQLWSSSANRGDFSRIMQLEIVDSHNALPLARWLLLRLFRFGFDFVFWLKFVCSGDSLDYLVSAPLLYCSTKNHPALLYAWTIAYRLNGWNRRLNGSILSQRRL